MNCLMHNSKTGKSLDFTTVCVKVKNGTPCEYCYVKLARDSGSFMAKTQIDFIDYKNEILKLKPTIISKLNLTGGLRLFSFADYELWMDPLLLRVIEDAKDVGLRLKAITKQRIFVDKYHNQLLINFSIDYMTGIPAWFSSYRNENTKLRALVRNKPEVEYFVDKVDILTPYHGKIINENYNPKEARETAINLAKNRVCCVTGKCETCEVRCGYDIQNRGQI